MAAVRNIAFVVVYFVLAFPAETRSEMCKTHGWFGSDCLYRCHCWHNSSCDQANGDCGTQGCARGFAGTACQYVDLAVGQPTNGSVQIGLGSMADAVDNNLITCFVAIKKGENFTWSVQLTEARWVNFVRVMTVNTSATAENLEVSLHNDEDNIHVVATPHITKPTDRHFLYHLSQPAKVSRVQIRTIGKETSLSLCDVNVFGGRNIALKKNATHGLGTRQSAVASRAVDGDTNGDFTQGSCTHTNTGKSWWTVFFGHPQHIWRVKVYNRQDGSTHRLGFFRVNITRGDGSTELVYQNSENTPPAVTDIQLPNATIGTELTVWHYKDEILTLCEVEVLGDCLNGYFGWLCDTECRCENSAEICDKVWGTCHVSGCQTGWTGNGCQQECLNGTYGNMCEANCSNTCQDHACHHVTGKCTNGCSVGWEGQFCNNTCKLHRFGENCSEECPRVCLGQQCDHVTGVCNDGCEPGLVGDNCTEVCGPGFHGHNCSEECSRNCVNHTCNAATGECEEGCVPGTTGTKCDHHVGSENETGMVAVGVVMAILLLSLLALLIGVIVRMQRRAASRTVKHEWHSGHENSRAELCEEADDVTDKGSNATQQKGFSGPASIEERASPVPKPRGASKRNKAAEHYELAETKGKAENTHPATGEVQTNKPEPRPRTMRPELMALFSRDASNDVSADVDMMSSSQPSTAESSPRSKRTTSTPAKRMASMASLDTLSVEELDTMQLQIVAPRRADDDSSDYYNIVYRDFSPKTVIMLSDLPAKMASWLAEPRHFNKERSLLPSGNTGHCEMATLPQNIRKNRYRDIYPYDQFRVVLNPLPDDPFSDYYNACYIDGYKTEKEYVAAQGPMESTQYDFLRMVWDLKSDRIVMLTNTVEQGRFKCQQYWPEVGPLTKGDITVTLESVTTFADYCIRGLIFGRGAETRRVNMFHYTAWPDNSAPASPWSLIDFRQKVRHMAPGEGPTIVHCSAGIGRTGTYLALDILLARAELEDKVDVFTCVWKLRKQRICMVQTLAQYIFIYETLAAALTTSAPSPFADFSLDLYLTEEKATRLLDQEFENLKMCLSPPLEKPPHDEDEDTGGHNPAELLGVPRDMDRVQVLSSDGRFCPVYINAIFLSSYTQARAFIQTHSPLEGGVVDFLSMVLQHNVTTIVCLDTTIGSREGSQARTVQYWPETTGKSLSFGPYRVSLLQTEDESSGCLTDYTLRITFRPPQDTTEMEEGQDQSSEREYSRDLTLFKFNQWPEQLNVKSVPGMTLPPTKAFLHLISAIKLSEQEPIVVHCRDGCTRSGLFCVAATVIERMREEDHVAVCYVTAHMRVPRRENIVSEEQYEFLYRCVQQALKDQSRQCHHDATADVDEDENAYGNIDISPTKPRRDDRNGDMDTPQAEDITGKATAPDAEHPYGNIGSVRAKTEVGTTGETTVEEGEANGDGNVERTSNIYGNVGGSSAVEHKQDQDVGEPTELQEKETDENIYSNA